MTLTSAPSRDHPVYAKVAASTPSDRAGSPIYYVGWADTAALVRSTLAARFPGTKFYVRSDSYSGGASVNVWYDGTVTNAWTRVDSDDKPYGPVVTNYADVDHRDGRWAPVLKAGAPRSRDVKDALAGFSGRRFDGMIDLGYSVSSWLNPDGTATLGDSSGTLGSRGSDPAFSFSRTHPRALLVHFLASYVFVNDHLPYGVKGGS